MAWSNDNKAAYISAFGGSYGKNVASQYYTKQERKYNSAEALKSFERQKELLQMEQAFNSAEAQKSFDRQLEASNSAYTRSVADLRNAGLNPILAASGGGASVPSSGVAFASSAPATSQASSSRVPSISSATDSMLRLVSSAMGLASAVVPVLPSKRSRAGFI